MSIAVAAVSSAVQGSGVTAVTSSPTIDTTGGTNRLMVAVISTWSGNDAASSPMVDVAGNTWIRSGTANFSGASGVVEIWYAKNATGNASETGTFTGDTASRWYSIVLLDATGIDTTSPNDVAASFTSNNATATLASSLITPASGDHLLIVVGAFAATAGVAQSVANAGTGAATWTVVQAQSWAVPIMLAYAIVTADGVKTYGVTYTNGGGAGNDNGVGIAAFKAAAAAAQDTPELRGRPEGLRGQNQMQQLLAV